MILISNNNTTDERNNSNKVDKTISLEIQGNDITKVKSIQHGDK